MKIVARRQALNLEYSPIKTAMGIALCSDRSLGDGYDYQPMDQRTAVHLIEAAFNEPLIEGADKAAWETFIDGLISRTASVMNMNDEALMHVEADLKNICAAPVQVDEEPTYGNGDDGLRNAARGGNLQLNPGNFEPAARNDMRSSIRQAVGSTKVSGLARR